MVRSESLSIAWIKDTKNGTSMGYGVGDELMGEATVKRIEQERVWIERSGQLELLKFNGNKKGTTKKASSKKPKKDDGDSGINKNGKDQYTVDQTVFDELMENPEKLYSQIRAVPKKENGEIIGYRLSGIRRKSIFYKLGVKNGDVVHGVNGKPLTNLSSAMDAYNSLSNSKNFSFDITRRKKKRTMEYEVR